MNLKKLPTLSNKVTNAISGKLKKTPPKDGLDLTELAEELTKRKIAIEGEDDK